MRVLAIIPILLLASCASNSDEPLESLMRSSKIVIQQRTALEFALQEFHRQHSRWPVDATEFWSSVPPNQQLLERSKFRRLEFTPKGDGSTFVEYELALEPTRGGCFNLKAN